MKKVMNKIILTLSFAIAFVLAATLPVSASEEFERISNVEVSGDDVKVYDFTGAGLTPEKIYLVENKDAQINLNYISNNAKQTPYESNIAIVKCSKASNLPGAKATCSKHVVTRTGDEITNALRSDAGFTFKIGEYYTSTTTVQSGEIINGVAVDTLDSVYGAKNVTFIIIDYVAKSTYTKWFKQHTHIEAQYSEVLTVLNLEDIGGGAVSASRQVNGDKMTAVADASFPVAKISYFIADAGLTIGNTESDFNQAATTAGVQVQSVTPNNVPDAIDTDARKGLVYRTEFEVDAVDGKSCYVYVQDELGHYDVIELPSDTTQDVVNDGGGSISNNNTDTTNPLANTDLGKIILIVLVAVLVLAAVLVIVQKIVDHKRRLY